MPDPLAGALADVEDQKLSAHPECMTDACDHDECPDWSALGCGDAAAIRAALAEQGYVIVNAEMLADELGPHRYWEDTEGVHGAGCECFEWDESSKVSWAGHAAAAIIAALKAQS